MTPIHVNDPDDPRIAAFRDVKERDLTGRQGLFVAEGEVVLRVLASGASLCAPVSVLIAEKRVEGLREVLERLPADVPVHVAPQSVLNAVAGFDLHRGVLALGRKPNPVEPGALLDAVSSSIKQVTGRETKASTSGGTSDGRFIATLGTQVVELGPVNATIHQVNERVLASDLDVLTDIYYHTLIKLLA